MCSSRTSHQSHVILFIMSVEILDGHRKYRKLGMKNDHITLIEETKHVELHQHLRKREMI